jgi:hypothetical protein
VLQEEGSAAVASLPMLTKVASAFQLLKLSRLHICDNLYCARQPCLCFSKRHSVTLLSIFWWTTRQNAVRSKQSPNPYAPLLFMSFMHFSGVHCICMPYSAVF